MPGLVLESFVGSNYADASDTYEFPPQYLNVFAPLTRAEPMVAVIYEPRGDRNDGRMAYVGWALLHTPPQRSGRKNSRGQDLWEVRYADRYREFDRIVPREATGEPIETWLRAIPRGRNRNVATFGKAVRPLSDDDLQLILSLGFPHGIERAGLEARVGVIAEPPAEVERLRRLVSAVQREARFRDDVLVAYAHRCAISGLAVGTSPSRAYGLLDAAHIRPVGSDGVDTVTNGLALTPTLHRLFDKGLFTLGYHGPDLRVRVSPSLAEDMIVGRDGFALRLHDQLDLRLPTNPAHYPAREQLDFHQSQVFIRH